MPTLTFLSNIRLKPMAKISKMCTRDRIDGDNVTYSLRVAPGDMGRVIGRHGRLAKEIRTLMKAAGNRENKRVTVDILD